MLTGPQAARLRSLAVDHLGAGHDDIVVTGTDVLHSGRRSPLTTLAQRCRDIPEEQWPELVRQHFARLENASRGDEDAEELLRGTRLRLLPDDAFPEEAAGSFRYVRPVADGLLAALALDTPESVRILHDGDVARVDAEQLWAAGRANLLAEPVRHEEVRTAAGAVLHSVYGDSHFVASRALALPELVREVTGRDLPEAGALVAVPTRHLLAFHPIADGTVVDAVNDLGSYALGACQDGPGSLTPRLYWWHRGRLVCLTHIDEETRSLSVRAPQELLELMKRLRGGQDSSPFATALAHAHAQAADDPSAVKLESWEAWVRAMQEGSALFATPDAPRGDGRAWLEAFWLALVCREGERLTRLSQVPVERLHRAGEADDYLFHWIGTLQAFVLRRPMDEVADRLVTTIQTSDPQVATRTPGDFLNLVDYQPIALFHRFIARDQEKFATVLAEALAHHGRYWEGSGDPRALVALGPLALASLAYDAGFPVDTSSPYLPTHLVQGSWYGEFPT
ncbi:immunity 49 family protein [Streptomyces sp. NPDC049915]|uniref:immunity 49 family protein n=1 Tax=Streptomyces sp. NPDC049915 TaxID=3155510 RepID=UPI00343F289B